MNDCEAPGKPAPRGVAQPLLDEICRFDTCTIANAIERFRVRLRNEGYTHEGLTCVTGEFPKAIGHAATFRVRSSEPSLTGNAYVERTDWWSAIQGLPVPRIAVIEDLDAGRGGAACVGEVHAAILKAFGCAGVVTNGAVRDIPGVREIGFPMFARSMAVSHSYSHMVDFGSPVEVFGLTVQSGDLLYVDCHGAVTIPLEIAADLPAAAEKIRQHERTIIDLCLSADFSAEKLLKAIQSGD